MTAPRPEAALEVILRDGVRHMGGMTEKVLPVRRGIPDRLVILPRGQIFLVELKADKGKLRPTQTVWHERAAKLGVEIVVLQGEAEVRLWLAEQKFILRKKYDSEFSATERERRAAS